VVYSELMWKKTGGHMGTRKRQKTIYVFVTIYEGVGGMGEGWQNFMLLPSH
jgi:hypothetical protein